MEIQGIQLWKDGAKKTATEFVINTEFDDMSTRAKFAYRLLTKEGEQVANGYLDIDGDDYKNWNGNNERAYEWAMKQLNLDVSK